MDVQSDMANARRITNTPGTSLSNDPTGKTEKPKRLEVWAFVVSIVALIPSMWVIAGLPTLESVFSNRSSAEKYLRAISGDAHGPEVPPGESATNALRF